mgnify:CR=1 FL=1
MLGFQQMYALLIQEAVKKMMKEIIERQGKGGLGAGKEKEQRKKTEKWEAERTERFRVKEEDGWIWKFPVLRLGLALPWPRLG